MQLTVALAVVLLLALAGCQAPAPVPEPESKPAAAPEPAPAPAPVEPPPPPVVVVTPGGRALADGVGLYDAGNFNGAIKQLLGAKEIWSDSTSADAVPNKVAANKYIAFSYCVTNRRTQCRKHFVDAIKLDAAFDLDPTEKTHPIWGPEFERAKKQASAAAAPAKRPAPPAAPSPNTKKAP
jgi:hypothetical protein